MTVQTGSVLGGRYELTERIAGGGMGEVWKGRDRVLGRAIAVKVVKPGLSDDESFRERFRNEARLSARLSHGNIAQVHDFGEEGGTAFLVMELVDGASVAELLSGGPIPLSRIAQVVRQTADGLDAAHEWGMVHRDVKPANLLLTARGTVKVTDFGIARALGEAKVTRTGEVLGTVQYMAPEVATGHDAGAQSDVYALAVVTYELLAGRRPFDADSAVTLALMHVNEPPPPLPTSVSPAVASVVMRGLAKNPHHRPNGTAAFARDLDAAINSAPTYGYQQPWSNGPVSPGPYVPVNRSLAPGPFGRTVSWVWIVLAVLTASSCFLPAVSLGSESWSFFQLADPATLKGEPRDSSDNAFGWLIAVPMLLVAALGVPAQFGQAHRAWPIVAIPGCLWSTLIYLGALGVATGTSSEPSPVDAAAGAFLVPLFGTLTLVAVVAAAIKPR